MIRFGPDEIVSNIKSPARAVLHKTSYVRGSQKLERVSSPKWVRR